MSPKQMGRVTAVFFLITGWLTIRSTYFPRYLGWISVVGGIGWLAFLWPPLGYQLNLYIAGFALLGSLVTIVWMLIYGVNEERWEEQARVAETKQAA